MARSHLLVSLVKAGASGDRTQFRRTVEALIAEERAKKHDVLAERLAKELQQGSDSQFTPLQSGRPDPGLLYRLKAERTFGDLVLPDPVLESCYELVEEQQRADLLRSHGLEPRHRVLLIGPPGNGKTSVAECLANSLMVPLLVARYEGLIGSYLGETAARLRTLFEHVRSRACVLFFDEFETLGKERGDIHETGEIKRVVSSLLLQIDRLPPHVVVVTATNHPELLDRAVWRRFQLRLELPQPTRKQTEEYFQRCLGAVDFDLGYAPRTLADKLKGASFSELEDFLANITRRYVLALPEADVKAITRKELEKWSERAAPPAHGE